MKTVAGITCFDQLDEILNPAHTGLVIVDMQNDFCDPAGHFACNGKDVSRIGEVIPRIARLIGHARAAKVPVFFIQQTTLAGHASDSPAWMYFKTRDGKTPDYTYQGTWGEEIVPALAPAAGDPVVRKLRPSAFLNTTLDVLLRNHGICSVVVAGCITQGCVQATMMDASFHDYYAVLAEDCVQSTNQELHENALRFLRSRYDTVDCESIARFWPALG